jgi:hypothetical protein
MSADTKRCKTACSKDFLGKGVRVQIVTAIRGWIHRLTCEILFPHDLIWLMPDGVWLCRNCGDRSMHRMPAYLWPCLERKDRWQRYQEKRGGKKALGSKEQ